MTTPTPVVASFYVGPLAQLVAHLHDAQGVRGSSPLRPTRVVPGPSPARVGSPLL
jgi:hypothetical protein